MINNNNNNDEQQEQEQQYWSTTTTMIGHFPVQLFIVPQLLVKKEFEDDPTYVVQMKWDQVL